MLIYEIVLLYNYVVILRCNGEGHFARDCPEGGGEPRERKPREPRDPRDGGEPRDRKPREPRDPREVTCYRCEKLGHFARYNSY